MKQKDIALIIFVTGVSALVSYAVGNYLLGGTNRETEVETIQQISSSFSLPDKRFFNEFSLNPTQTIQIGDTTNPDPFAGGPITSPVQ